MSGAAFNTGKSKQDYSTPDEFIRAVNARFGDLTIDLAATRDNAKVHCGPAPVYIGPGSCLGGDSLAVKWSTLAPGRWWLNPPFANIEPWVRKCAAKRPFPTGITTRNIQDPSFGIYLLIPASVGANWWATHVHNKARVHFLSPRLCFDGKNPYPKDCALCIYPFEHSFVGVGYECWRWK
jgi:hypothetical protein